MSEYYYHIDGGDDFHVPGNTNRFSNRSVGMAGRIPKVGGDYYRGMGQVFTFEQAENVTPAPRPGDTVPAFSEEQAAKNAAMKKKEAKKSAWRGIMTVVGLGAAAALFLGAVRR